MFFLLDVQNDDDYPTYYQNSYDGQDCEEQDPVWVYEQFQIPVILWLVVRQNQHLWIGNHWCENLNLIKSVFDAHPDIKLLQKVVGPSNTVVHVGKS